MTHEEKLQEAERLYKTANSGQRYVLESLFPELAESEDERIRKALLRFHKSTIDIDGIKGGDILAWLEKQGEQNLIMANSPQLGEQKPTKNIVETWKDMRLEVYQQASGNRHEPNYSDDTTKMFSLSDIDEIIEKMSEQNKNIELTAFESALFTAFSYAWQQYLRGKEVDIAQWAKEHSKELLEAAKEELKGHNSAWSEEDEQITLSIEQVMNCASLLNIVPEKMDKIRTWLKSLKDRCTWKPSSLQMECLHDAIKHYHTNGYPASKLKELYEQMSKIYKL